MPCRGARHLPTTNTQKDRMEHRETFWFPAADMALGPQVKKLPEARQRGKDGLKSSGRAT